MKFKLNPLTGEFDYTSESANKQKLNPLTGEFNLVEGDGPFSQIFNPLSGTFNLGTRGGGGIIAEVTGNGYINLTNAVANHLMELKAYGGTEQSNLPKGYTQYEYLRSSGTQYIDLGYKGNGNTKVEVKFKYHTTTSATGSGRVFGSRITSQNNAFAIGTSSGIVSDTTNKVFRCYDGQSYFIVDANFGLDVWQTVVFSATEHTVNGVIEGDDYEITEFETPNNLLLFAFDNNGTIGVGYVDIAYCKLWNNGVLVRDLIPCKNSSNVFGMYDRVSETLLTNAGTGTFETGNTAVPTPEKPMNIVSNNGVLKLSKNMANVNTQTALVGYYISTQGQVLESPYNRIYQEFIPCKPNTKYTISMSSSVYFISISEYSTAEDSGFIRRSAGSTGGNTQLTITTRSNTNYLRFGANLSSSDITIDNVLAINWQLEQGDTPTPYHEYVEGGIYIDGITETIGLNLLDLGNVDNGHYYSGTGEYISSNVARLSNLVSVKAGDTISVTTQVLSGATLNIRYNFFDTSKQWLSQSMYSLPISEGEHTENLTIQQDGYFAFSGNYTGTGTILDWNNVVIMNNEKNVTAEMLLKVGDYADEQEILSGNITRKVGVLVLDGVTAGKMFSSAWNATYKRCNLTISDMLISVAATEDAVCNFFPYSSSVNTSPTSLGFCTNNGYLLVSFIGMEDITSANAANAFLAAQYNAGTPVIVLYPLAEPTTESVARQAMHIPAGGSTIEIIQASIDNLPLYAKYLQSN